MKKLATFATIGLSALLLFGGCVASVGGGPKTTIAKATLGQELIDLQNAKNAGALTDAEYQQQKAKLLDRK